MTEGPSPERYLVVGSGSIGKRHMANLRTLFPEAKIDCVSSSGRPLDPAGVGADRVCADLDSAIEGCPRFAVVAGAAPSHIAQAAKLLDAGIAVLVEKPLADSLERVAEFEQSIRRNLDRIAVGYNLRFLGSAVRLKQAIEDEEIGALHSVSVDTGQYLPDWRPGQDYRDSVSSRRELGGGALLELSHEVDYVRWLFGPIERVFCQLRNTGVLDIDVEDVADAMLIRKDGLVVQIHLDFLQRAPSRRCRVVGDRGTLIWDAIADRLTLMQGPGRSERVLFEPVNGERNDTYIAELRHFSEFVRRKVAPSVSFDDGLETLRVVQAMRKSSEHSELVRVHGELP